MGASCGGNGVDESACRCRNVKGGTSALAPTCTRKMHTRKHTILIHESTQDAYTKDLYTYHRRTMHMHMQVARSSHHARVLAARCPGEVVSLLMICGSG